MEHLLSSRRERELHISNFLEVFENLSDEELIDSYKSALTANIEGVHLQALHIIALDLAIIKRFKKPLIELKDITLSINEGFEIPNLSLEIKDPKIQIAKELKDQSATQTDTESQVIIHIDLGPYRDVQRLRIWNNTYLKCHQTARKSKMLFSENIAVYPNWCFVKPGTIFSFTLIFENLPKDCLAFDLIEDIPEMGGFFFKGIRRNNSNVYHLRM
ncbi:hypothetical protein [Aequorivita sp. KMM 9714]|uniref:hypothetical protein n=1 Tax=Aequorivita sp. KMM 9714 TaxID=2707173 RepID=UPI0013EE11BA|nr:hypothetical protein [Aequorivita sp. KMM 9714]NGX85264.1 hypothetical protein [Aequorivita sp. KMM 9714]